MNEPQIKGRKKAVREVEEMTVLSCILYVCSDGHGNGEDTAYKDKDNKTFMLDR